MVDEDRILRLLRSITDDIVTDRLKALNDLEDFVGQVTAFVASI